jgi:hypothetical protein
MAAIRFLSPEGHSLIVSAPRASSCTVFFGAWMRVCCPWKARRPEKSALSSRRLLRFGWNLKAGRVFTEDSPGETSPSRDRLPPVSNKPRCEAHSVPVPPPSRPSGRYHVRLAHLAPKRSSTWNPGLEGSNAVKGMASLVSRFRSRQIETVTFVGVGSIEPIGPHLSMTLQDLPRHVNGVHSQRRLSPL